MIDIYHEKRKKGFFEEDVYESNGNRWLAAGWLLVGCW